MTTSDEHARAYGELRAAVLSRHFALRRYWRADLLSLVAGLAAGDDVRSSSRADQVRQRWDVITRDRGENPLMMGGMLATCLAIEAGAGNRESLYALRGYLHTLRTLYPYVGDGFEGYAVRWDPYTSEKWEERDGAPVRCTEFISREGGGYWPVPPRGAVSLPPLEPTDDQAAQDARYAFLAGYRSVELSQDELVGLVATYSVIHQFVDDRQVRTAVRTQAAALGGYLAGCGYHLVRPGGDFNARGPAGFTPALEHPYSRVFRRITGRAHASRVEFPGALQRAGVWEGMAGPYGWASVLGVIGAPILDAIPVVHPLLRAVVGTIADADVLSAIELARAWQIAQHGDVFDVWDVKWGPDDTIDFTDGTRLEFVLSFMLGKIPRQRRWEIVMAALGIFGSRGNAQGFPQYVALTALGDRHPTVVAPYLRWFLQRQAVEQRDGEPKFAGTALSAAIAVALGERTWETTLVERLEAAHDALRLSHGSETWHDLWIAEGAERPFTDAYDNAHCALDYLAALAVAWFHERRLRGTAQPVTTPGFPTMPELRRLPPARMPSEIVALVRAKQLPFAADALVDNSGTLFAADAPRKPAPRKVPADRSRVAGWARPTSRKPQVSRLTFNVSEASADVDTGIDVAPGDQLEFRAAGRIWAGVILTGENGPNGWDRIEHSAAFPLHGEPDGFPFALLGRIQGYFFIGDGRSLGTREWIGPPGRLRLRVNDDVPGNGDGRFTCTVTLFR
jgi:hypothetical protein